MSRTINKESAEQLRNSIMALDSFLNDGGYEEVDSNDRVINDRSAPDRESDDEEGDYQYGNGRERRRRASIPEYPFQTTPISLNKTWLCVLACLVFFTLGYYQLGKIEKRKARIEVLSAENEKLKSSIADGSAASQTAQPKAKVHDGTDGKENHSDEAKVEPKDIPPFDPFNLHQKQQLLNYLNDWYGAPFVVNPPKLPIVADSTDEDSSTTNGYSRLGYFQFPTIVNKTLVFSSEGDLYLTRIQDDSNETMPAMKLTMTVGNAIHPKLNPKYHHLLAYSATYTGVREVYLMDLRAAVGVSQFVTGVPGTPGGPALRLTYTPGGIISVVGWDEAGESILYSAMSMDDKALPDVRLFRLWLSSRSVEEVDTYLQEHGRTNTNASVPKHKNESANENIEHDISHSGGDSQDEEEQNRKRNKRLQRHLDKLLSEQARRNSLGAPSTDIRPILEPVPLAQATEGVYHTIATSKTQIECIYFTRFKQSSSTRRYVGGTAESLWVYCPGENDDLAIPLTRDYNGTSKAPSVYKYDDVTVLLFMSDRREVNNTNEPDWIPSTMNLWAMQLPLLTSDEISRPIQITSLACSSNGMDLSEYTMDPSVGGVILRVGADLQYIPEQDFRNRISSSFEVNTKKHSSKLSEDNQPPLPIAVYSDFSNMQKRSIPFTSPEYIDAFETSYGSMSVLVTGRGQTFVAPIIPDTKIQPQTSFGGVGRNMPYRRYKVAPGTGGEGLTRILFAGHIPRPETSASLEACRLALVLATDPLSPTGEHAFYIVRIDHETSPSFGFASLFKHENLIANTGLPAPFLGGHLETGGSTRQGGLGSVFSESIRLSPCGRRAAWTDTDGRVVTMTIPALNDSNRTVDVVVLPRENENKQPLGGEDVDLVWSPGGRYLAIQHSAHNQFSVISIGDLGSPEDGTIHLGRIVQATPDRFNSFSPVWGKTQRDFVVEAYAKVINATSKMGATALFFLSDRDVKLSEPSSPWGTRSPQPHFEDHSSLYVLPLDSMEDDKLSLVRSYVRAQYAGGAASEVSMIRIKELDLIIETMKAEAELSIASGVGETNDNAISSTTAFAVDGLIDFGEQDKELSFARRAYRLGSIPSAKYSRIMCQLEDDPSFVVMKKDIDGEYLQILATADYPLDAVEAVRVPVGSTDSLEYASMSASNNHILLITSEKLKIVRRTAAGIEAFMKDTELTKDIAHLKGLHIDIWPALEFQQMYKDAWRMLRDYFWDAELTGLLWDDVFYRYLPLVERCSKREELDDVLRQMAGELNTLHVFVFGGEYMLPNHGDDVLDKINAIASLGAVLERSVEKNGYIVVSIPVLDPDFQTIDGGVQMYSPLSRTLEAYSMAGLQPGDMIVGVNGENVMNVPDIHALLQNKAGESIRLEVIRYNSTSIHKETQTRKQDILRERSNDNYDTTEPLIVVPISYENSYDLFYGAWEYKTRQHAKKLAADAGFTTGYIHIQDMSGASAEDAFVRGYYPDYDKQALIIDVRNNRGGNIDSWILDVLQRKAWMYWQQSRTSEESRLWNSRFAFRGHIVVLINEHTSSDGEAFARGVSELGLGKLVGTRTWGGGIWLSSDNRLVDGGVASAPEIGTFNERLGWGLGIEQMGVEPDFEVDNNPRSAYNGEDAQLIKAISVLKGWLVSEPVTFPKPGPKKKANVLDDVARCSVGGS